jgi:hypothetical protein
MIVAGAAPVSRGAAAHVAGAAPVSRDAGNPAAEAGRAPQRVSQTTTASPTRMSPR